MKLALLVVVVFLFACNTPDKPNKSRIHLWNNTLGEIREIKTFEKKNTPINAVGILECQLSDGKFTNSTAIITTKLKTEIGKGLKNIILFSGHSLCDNGRQMKKNECQFIHEYQGKVSTYPLRELFSLYQCNDNTFSKDIAIASIPYFDKSNDVFLAQTKEIKRRRIMINEEVLYKSDNDKKYADSEQLLVGFDLFHKKLMVSKNCGLFHKSNKKSLFNDEKDIYSHDCLQTQGYSGGAIFMKQYDLVNDKNNYKLICINSGAVAYDDPKHKNYRQLLAGETGGRCVAINNKMVAHLYNSLE
jgi:hypothetical protein